MENIDISDEKQAHHNIVDEKQCSCNENETFLQSHEAFDSLNEVFNRLSRLRNRNGGEAYQEIILFPPHIAVVWQRRAIWRFSNTHERLIGALARSNDV